MCHNVDSSTDFIGVTPYDVGATAAAAVRNHRVTIVHLAPSLPPSNGSAISTAPHLTTPPVANGLSSTSLA
jgi:hypothetical protein